MEIKYQGAGNDGFVFLAVAAGLLGLVSTLFWMWVAWRAMLAHEEIARAMRDLADRSDSEPPRVF
jgi:O-antigen ligase